MLSVLNKIASILKGCNYQLDPTLSLPTLFLFGIRRLTWLIRGKLAFPTRTNSIFLDRNITLISKRSIKFGRAVTIGKGSLIDGLSTNGIVLGDNVNIGPYVQIQSSGVLTKLGAGLSMGNNTGIGGYSFIGAAGGVTIGNDVIMGQYVSFHSENHNYENLNTPIRLQGVTRKGITVGDNCWIGAKVTFLDGTNVGYGCVVAAGSVVRGEIPPNSVIAGVPAKVIRTREINDSISL